MRTPFVLLGIVILTAILGPVVLVAGMLGVEERPRGIYQRCMHAWCRGILRISGVKVEAHHPERMSENQGHVYIANHRRTDLRRHEACQFSEVRELLVENST